MAVDLTLNSKWPLTPEECKVVLRNKLGYPNRDVELKDEDYAEIIQNTLDVYDSWRQRRVQDGIQAFQTERKIDLVARNLQIFGETFKHWDVLDVQFVPAYLDYGNMDPFTLELLLRYGPSRVGAIDYYEYKYYGDQIRDITSTAPDWIYYAETKTLHLKSRDNRAYNVAWLMSTPHTLSTIPYADKLTFNKLMTAYGKIRLGELRSKFALIAPDGNTVIDGEKLKTEGKADLDAIMKDFVEPPEFIVG